MKVCLCRKKIEGIIDDVLQHMKRAVGVSKMVRKTQFYRDTLVVINQYGESLKSQFVPILISDYAKEVSISICGGKMQDEDVNKLLGFKEMLIGSDLSKYRDALELGLRGVMDKSKRGYDRDRGGNIEAIIIEGHKEIEKLVTEEVRRAVLQETKDGCNRRLMIETGVNNFTSLDLDDNLLELIKLGVNSVPRFKLSYKEVKRRVDQALIGYIRRCLRKEGMSLPRTGKVD